MAFRNDMKHVGRKSLPCSESDSGVVWKARKGSRWVTREGEPKRGHQEGKDQSWAPGVERETASLAGEKGVRPGLRPKLSHSSYEP